MKETWKQLHWIVKLVIIIVLIIIAFIVLRWLYVQYKKYQAENLLNNAMANYTAGGTSISVNYGSIAQQIYDAFYNNDIFGWTEDEGKAITAINNVPKALIPQLRETYFAMYGKNLNEDCIKYLGDDYSKVQHLLT